RRTVCEQHGLGAGLGKSRFYSRGATEEQRDESRAASRFTGLRQDMLRTPLARVRKRTEIFSTMANNQYAHPEALVETDWLEKHLKDDGIRVIESNEDILLYDTGHIPGAVHIDWRADLQDPLIRDYISPDKFARLCSRHGITPETTCIFYGDKANWWACYALWAFRLFGHEKVKILNGGRDKWKAEGRAMTREIPKYAGTNYPVPKKRLDREIRRFFDEALAQSKMGRPLIDVRSPGEYRGEITHMPEYPQEGVLRGGHIPGAKSMPWKTATNDDATFKPAAELAKIYFEQCSVSPDKDTVVYCRIGERSSHTWFVLTYLLGLNNVRNYDGSWTEWGNKAGAPIEKSAKARFPDSQTRPVFASSSRISCIRFRSFLLERSFVIERCIRRVQFWLAFVPGTLKRYLRARRSVIMT